MQHSVERRNPRRGNGEGFGIPSAELSKPTKNQSNPQGPRLFLRVSREADGHTVSLHGVVGGRLVTLARGLTESEAQERAAVEAAARGLEVRL